MRWYTACRLTSATLQTTRTPVTYSSRTRISTCNTARASVARWRRLYAWCTKPIFCRTSSIRNACKLYLAGVIVVVYYFFSSANCWMQPWAEWNVPSRLAGKSIKHAHFVWFMSFSCMYMSVHHLKTCQCAKRTVNTSRFLSSVDGQPGLTASLTLTMKRVAPSPLPLDFINSAKFEVRQRSAFILFTKHMLDLLH